MRRSVLAAALSALACSMPAAAQSDAQPAPAAKPGKTSHARALDVILVLGKREDSYATDDATIAGKSSTALKETPNSISVINRKMMDDAGMTSVEDAMQWATGIAVTPQGDGSFVAYNRGYDAGAQFDGLPATKGITSMMQIDLSMYDRIEIQRGPSGLLQGSGTPGGSINLVRKRAPRTFAGNFDLSLGSWNNRRAALDVGAPLNAAGSVRGRLVLSSLDTDFFYDVAANKRDMAYAVLEADLGSPDTTLAVSGSWQRSRYTRFWGLPTYVDGRQLNAPRHTFTGTDWSVIRQPTREGVIELGHRFGNGWTLKGAARYRDNNYDARIAYNSSAVTPGSTAGQYLTSLSDHEWVNRGLEINLTGPLELWGRTHDVLIGYNRDALDQFTGFASGGVKVDDIFHPDLPISVAPDTIVGRSEFQVRKSAWYGQLRLRPFDGWTWVLGGRSSSNANRSRETYPHLTQWKHYASNVSGKITPYAGAVWEFRPDTAWYASYSYTFQPNEYFQYDGKAIDPREGWQIETGIKQGFIDDHLQGTLALYRIREINRPFVDDEHVGCGASPTSVCWLPMGLVQSQGWEAELVGRIRPGWNISASYTFNDARYLKDRPANNGQKFQTHLPRHQAKLWTQYDSAPEQAQGWFVGGGINGQSRRWSGVTTATTQARSQGGYAVFSFSGGWRFNRHATLDVIVNNVFDRVYYRRVGGIRSGNYYGDPRNVTVRLRTRF
ncbi:TonB-dependent siderophore receptor [Luteimonas sp. e5]